MTPSPEEARHVLWGEAPDLLPLALLTPIQLRFHHAWHANAAIVYVLRCARRVGKSWWALLEAVVASLLIAGHITRYAAPTGKMVEEIIRPNMEHPDFGIWRTCPEHLRPRWKDKRGAYVFPNGSIIQIAGCDNGNYNRLRGVGCNLAIADEAGFIAELRKVIYDVLLPQTLTTGGRLLLPSTPSETAAHDFYAFDVAAQERGAHQHATIHDATHIPEERVEQYAVEVGGKETSTWIREYLAEWVVDEAMAVVPEFAKMERADPPIIREWTRPAYFDAYVSMDVGFHDLTVVGFSYRDFFARKTIQEDELVLQHATSKTIAQAVAAKERALWGDKKPHLRVVDAPEQIIADLNEFHGVPSARYAAIVQSQTREELAQAVALPWCPARKDDANAALNQLRMEIGAGDYVLHPRCKVTALHLRTGVWNKTRKSYARGDAQVGHFDGIDQAKYLVRHVLPNKNPYPLNWRGESGATHWMPPKSKAQKSPEAKAIEAALKRRTA